MFKAITRIALPIVIVASAAGRPCHAQTLNAQPVAPGYTKASEETAAELLKAADASLGRRDFGRARLLYRRAAAVESTDGRAPIQPLLRLANAHYLEGRDLQAAEVLEEVAVVAAQHGDIVAEADAYLLAAVMYGGIGHEAQFYGALDKLRKVMQSPYMPAAERERLMLRLQAR